MSLLHAKNCFDDAMKRLADGKMKGEIEYYWVIFDVIQGLSALSEGLEKEATEVKMMLANIHRGPGSSTGQ